jgi:hypothetical protein
MLCKLLISVLRKFSLIQVKLHCMGSSYVMATCFGWDSFLGGHAADELIASATFMRWQYGMLAVGTLSMLPECIL